MRFLACLILFAANLVAADHGPGEFARVARQHRAARERAIIDEFAALLALPNIARNRADMQRNAEYIRGMMQKRGIRTELLETPGAPPFVYGELITAGANQTVMFYAHYDGQPVEPDRWTDSGPFAPVLRDEAIENGGKIIPLPAGRFLPHWRLYARSASDDKAPIMAILSALDALRAANLPLRSNFKFILDGEEEAGSPHIGTAVRQYQEKLKADVWIFCDGPVHQTRKQQIVFGVRGSMGFNLTVYGPRQELHSGHYGNWAPNPASMLARLVASLRDDDGRVLVPGFYDDVEPLSEAEKQAIAAAPEADSELKESQWLGRLEGNGKRLEELVTLPSLNIRGLAAAGVGSQSRNVIPSEATASIDIRLVKGMDHRRTMDKVIAHVRAQGYHLVESEPDAETRKRYPKICRLTRAGGNNGVRAPMDSPIATKVIQAVKAARGEVVLLPNMGGSLPIAPIAEVLQVPVIIVPIANHDNNQHGHNENIRIQNLWDGIETMAALLALN